MKNPCFSHLLKIGLAKDVYKRKKSLSNSSVPESYEILKIYHVKDMEKAEKQIFKYLSSYRYKKGKEFFTCPVFIAQKTCELVTMDVNQDIEPDEYNIDDIFDLAITEFYM